MPTVSLQALYSLHILACFSTACARTQIKALVPDARVEFAHGRMKASELEEVMAKVQSQHIDILVCTTIVENGLDLPKLNTIVITYSHMLGLAQVSI